jgi:hypothetical protein
MTIDDYDKAYAEFHMRLLTAFIDRTKEQPPFCLEDCGQEDQDFFLELTELPNSGGADLLMQGQQLFCRIVAAYPHLMPLVPRVCYGFLVGTAYITCQMKRFVSFKSSMKCAITQKQRTKPFRMKSLD